MMQSEDSGMMIVVSRRSLADSVSDGNVSIFSSRSLRGGTSKTLAMLRRVSFSWASYHRSSESSGFVPFSQVSFGREREGERELLELTMVLL